MFRLDEISFDCRTKSFDSTEIHADNINDIEFVL